MLRVHFTSDDLSRVRFARGPDPLWEAVLSIHVLGTAQGRAVFDPWRARVRAGLGQALHGYHSAAVAPYWPRMQALVDAERAVRARALLDHGSEGLLTGLGPAIRWKSPVLEADYPVEHDIHLAGRGLVLVPSAFCWRTPVTLIDPGLPPVLVYPLPRTPDWWAAPGSGTGPHTLANLLGRSRAACLRAVEDGCTTGELARRLGVTPPTASQHATTLREAGLTTSTRQGNTVLHTLTPLGTALLHANPSA